MILQLVQNNFHVSVRFDEVLSSKEIEANRINPVNSSWTQDMVRSRVMMGW